MKERPDGKWEDCEKELDTLFIEEKFVIERTHKVKTDKNKKSNNYL